ncbi:Na+/glucose cotransporter [Flagellimonas taeanensis]|uniref:Solute:Na+ symporter, SSS family n=1 Tax=Flagellimonas taeanensis TaxID=1005926 RepID=A0A1M6WER4_9FLAO|nr:MULTISPECIES: sodium:solute symporter [Allomuricauda]MDC6386735.1 sodium:solute symporter [Muricauda sp. SK9]MEE1964404.1 sodium:solute symporter [Allomuricauda taeanensis]RIV49965.1 Na+/glucose cotransporter [Allomuricauda taeanensis]SFC44020.1 solute:Na+ symporter, SSS family [Allomuricauda taeanensis]SHK91985.1 solute:Na+ symporter, SSS family [Allomuricauda taeanensis]
MESVLERPDWIVLGIYFLALIAVAAWVVLQKNKDTEDYFLAGRNVGWFVIGASIFASNIGSEHVVGLAGTGFESGTPMAHYELHAWIVLLLGWLFLPFYIRSGAFTMPEFLEKRFDSRSRWFLSIFSLVAYVLTKVSVTIYAGGIVVSELLGIPFWYGAIGVVVFTGIYTIVGGMKAVIYTETLQTVILILGSLTITYLGLQEVGGWGQLRETVTSVSPDHFNMWRPMSDPQFPWTGLLIGGTIVGIWYWCTDQYIVQRTLAANNIKIGRRGAIFGAYLKLMPILIFLIPGIIAFALTIQNPEVFNVDRADRAFPMLVKTLLPVGLKGLVAGGLMAALMSSLASVFNSCSTIFTMDIYKKLRPEKTERELLTIGKVATGIIVVLGIIWIPIMDKIGGGVMYQYLQNVQSYIAPPVTAVFLLGILWKRVNSKAAITTLLAGLVLLVLRLGSEIYYQPQIVAGEEVSGFLFQFATVNFAHMAIFMFIFSVVLCVSVSLATTPPDYVTIKGLSFGTLSAEDKAATKGSYSKVDVVLSVLLVIIVIAILSYFTG